MLDTRRRRLGARTTYTAVAVAAAAAVVLRLPFLNRPAFTDEGGMLVVARLWHTGGPFLYGDIFLARPPLLIAFFRLCDELGGVLPVRVLGLGLVVLAILAAAWGGSSLAGRRGAITAAVVAAALLSDPRLGTREIDAETVGLPLTMLSAALVLAALRRTTSARGRAVLLAAAGMSAVGALLAKQNLADSVAFAMVLVVASAFADGRGRRALTDLGWLALGAAVPLAATLAWLAVSGFSVGDFVYTLYGFRVAGGQTMMARPTSAQGERLNTLVWAVLKSGMVPLLLVSLLVLRRRLLREPAVLALLAMLLTALVGVAGGGAYWIHYSLGLVPVTALLAGRAAGELRRPSALLAAAVAFAVVASLMSTNTALHRRPPVEHTWLGGMTTWLDATKQPGDTMVVLYGQAAIFESTHIHPAYPYIWTLPMRVRDPQLTELKALLSGPHAPTFVLGTLPLNSWDIDADGSLQRTLGRSYVQAGDVCGTQVYLRRGVTRPWVAPPADCPAPG